MFVLKILVLKDALKKCVKKIFVLKMEQILQFSV